MSAEWSRHGRDILAGTGACVLRGQTMARDSNAQDGALGMWGESRLSRAAGFCAWFLAPQLLPSLLPFWLLLIQIAPSPPHVS